MANSSTDIVQVARSSEKYDGVPAIDPEYLDGKNAREILERNKNTDNKKNADKAAFKSISLGKKRALISLALTLTLILSLTACEQFFRTSAFAHGVQVGHVEIGGKSNSAAKKLLEAKAQEALKSPMQFSLGKETVSISSQDIDLNYDIDASLRKAKNLGDSLNPVFAVANLFQRYTVGQNINPVVKYDKAKFQVVIDHLVDNFSKGRADAGVSIDGTQVTVIKPKTGTGVSLNQAKAALAESISTFSRNTIEFKSEKVDARISLAQAQATAQTLRTMFSKPSTLTTPGGNTITISPEQLSAAIVLKPKRNSLEISIDEKIIRTSLADQLASVEVAPVDATFAVNGNSVSVVPSILGKNIDFKSALKNWINGEHDFITQVLDVNPAHDTKWANSLNITELVSSFSTNFPAGQTRVKNIARAAEQVNNTIVEPGKTFSLNETLGKRTAENGYFRAPVYSDKDGFFEDFGGGASQFSTTLFNAAFIGGYKDVTHTPHTIYISRYPLGREATLNWGSIDMAFKNDSNSGVLIKTYMGTTSISVSIFGNKEGRKVTLEGPVEIARTPIAVEYTDDPNLPIGEEKEVQHGYPGIVVENYRTVDRPGKPGRRERYRWTYNMVPTKKIRGTKPI